MADSLISPDGVPTSKGNDVLERVRQVALDSGTGTAEFERLLESTGLAVLGDGQARVVVHAPEADVVAKLSTAAVVYQNRREATLWNENLSAEARQFFAPIHFAAADFGYVIQDAVDTVGLSLDEHLRLLEVLVLEYGLDLMDQDPTNVGRLNGRPVVFDYGTTRTVDENPRFEDREELFAARRAHVIRRRT